MPFQASPQLQLQTLTVCGPVFSPSVHSRNPYGWSFLPPDPVSLLPQPKMLYRVPEGCLAPAREGLRWIPDPPKDWSQHLAGDAIGTTLLLHVVRSRDRKEEDRLSSTCCKLSSPAFSWHCQGGEEEMGKGKGQEVSGRLPEATCPCPWSDRNFHWAVEIA